MKRVKIVTDFGPDDNEMDNSAKFHDSLLDQDQLKSLTYLRNNANTSELSSNMLFWQFILYLLDNQVNTNVNIGLKWQNRDEGYFIIKDPHVLSNLWGVLNNYKYENDTYIIIVENALR